MGGAMSEEHEGLHELIDLNQWNVILNRFSEVLGTDIYTVDRSGKVITPPQRLPKIWKLVDGAKEPARLKLKAPSETLQSLIRKSEATHTPVDETGPLGITHALIPVWGESSQVVAYLIVGPLVLGSRKLGEELSAMAQEQGWEALDLEGAYQELKLFSFIGMKAMLDLLSGVCNYLVKPAALKGEQEQAVAEWTLSLGKSLPTHSEALDNFFDTLLHLALRTTNADSGSIMILDPVSQSLRIRASHGLKEEVIKEAEVKMGEGIAGWVAARNESLLLDNERAVEPSLQNRLKRKEIDSSIIMPLSRQNQVLGVLNVNSHHKHNRLKAQSLDLLTQLANLTMSVF